MHGTCPGVLWFLLLGTPEAARFGQRASCVRELIALGEGRKIEERKSISPFSSAVNVKYMADGAF